MGWYDHCLYIMVCSVYCLSTISIIAGLMWSCFVNHGLVCSRIVNHGSAHGNTNTKHSNPELAVSPRLGRVLTRVP